MRELMEDLLNALENYDTEASLLLSWLDEVYPDNGVVHFQGQWMYPSRVIPKLAKEELASQMYLYYWGGPPQKRKYFNGSILNYVTDRLLTSVSEKPEIARSFIRWREQEKELVCQTSKRGMKSSSSRPTKTYETASRELTVVA